MSEKFAMDGYVDVAERIRLFKEKHPDGSLRPVNPEDPVRVVVVGDKTFLQYVAAAYRSPEDACPGIGVAWELFPGRTPYTKDSEAMVAETSAWGRAIVATLAADTKRVASANEVRNARATTEVGLVLTDPESLDGAKRAVAAEWRRLGMTVDDGKIDYAATHDGLILADADLSALAEYLAALLKAPTP